MFYFLAIVLSEIVLSVAELSGQEFVVILLIFRQGDVSFLPFEQKRKIGRNRTDDRCLPAEPGEALPQSV